MSTANGFNTLNNVQLRFDRVTSYLQEKADIGLIHLPRRSTVEPCDTHFDVPLTASLNNSGFNIKRYVGSHHIRATLKIIHEIVLPGLAVAYCSVSLFPEVGLHVHPPNDLYIRAYVLNTTSDCWHTRVEAVEHTTMTMDDVPALTKFLREERDVIW